MPLATLIAIALRLYAIYWLVNGVSTLVESVPISMLFAQKMGPDSGFPMGTLQIVEYVGIPALMIVIAAVLWIFADWISARVVRGHESTISFSSLTKEDLYHFAFIFLGLYFLLSSLYSGIQNAYHFFAFDFTLSENDPAKGRFLLPFLGNLVTVMAGLVCVFAARKWTRILLKGEAD